MIKVINLLLSDFTCSIAFNLFFIDVIIYSKFKKKMFGAFLSCHVYCSFHAMVITEINDLRWEVLKVIPFGCWMLLVCQSVSQRSASTRLLGNL